MIGYIAAFLAGLAVIPFIEEIKHQLDLRTIRKADKLEALVNARIAERELESWGIIPGPQPEDNRPPAATW